MFRPTNPNPKKYLRWYTADADECKTGVLVKSNSGADPVAAAHTGQTILGVVVEDSLVADAEVLIHSVVGEILEIDYYASSTKQTFAATDLGTLYDIIADGTTGEQFLDLDDTTGGFLFLVGYDNDRKKAYVAIDAADILLNV